MERSNICLERADIGEIRSMGWGLSGAVAAAQTISAKRSRMGAGLVVTATVRKRAPAMAVEQAGLHDWWAKFLARALQGALAATRRPVHEDAGHRQPVNQGKAA
jgi:hypothetical protein